MAVTRNKEKKATVAARIAAVGCASLLVAGCIGYGIAAAGGGAADASEFGLSAQYTAENSADAADTSAEQTTEASAESTDTIDTDALSDAVSDANESSILSTSAKRDISQGVQEIADEEEAARIAAEQARIAEENAHIAAAEQARDTQAAKSGQEAMAQLSDIDWEQGKDAFIAEWTSRIDAYLAGSSLAGYGAAFATAAWEYGVDPRWSPAISNTESSKGANCFASHNAWGWGSSSWSTWEEAIDAHVANLAKNYGYTISYANAKKYCPPSYDSWFKNTLSEMKKI